MKRLLGVALGILTAIGGFVDIGDLVTNAVVGSRFGLSLVWVVAVGVVGIILFANMSGRVAAVSGRATFEVIRERLGPRAGLANLSASFLINLMTVTAEIGGVALALQLASSVYYLLWIPVAAVAVWLVIWRVRFSIMENVTGLLGLTLMVFAVALFLLKPDWASLAGQLAPAVPQQETVDLAAETQVLFAFYEALAEEKEVALVLEGAGSVPGDRLMIRRALSNLLSNALRYTARGKSVSVRIEPLDSGETRLAVENPGEDIAPELLPRLFDRFYRLDASRHKTSEGTGLGLPITRSILEAHHAAITASSANGTIRFEIRFPAAQPAQATPSIALSG